MATTTETTAHRHSSAETTHLGAEMEGYAPSLIRLGAAARLLRPVHANLILCSVLSALGVAAGFAPYIAVAEIARALLTAPELAAAAGAVWLWVGIGVGGALLRLVMLVLSTYTGHRADAKVLHHLRTEIARHLGIMSLGWFRSAGSGQVKKAMTHDLEQMHHMIAHALGEIVGAVTAILFSFGYLVLVDWRMALVSIAVPLLAMLCYRISMRAMPQHMARLTKAESRISAASVEYTDGIAVAKTFGTGGRVLDRFDEAVREPAEAMRTWVAEVRYSSAVNQVFSAELTVLVVVLAIGLGLVSIDALTIVDLLPFLVVGIGLPTSLQPMTRGAQGVRTARMAAARIENLLNREPLPEATAPKQSVGHRIEIDQVTFSYDGVTNALDGVSLVCEPGTVTALVGPSGAGKSTLASLLPRFYDVTSGEIRIGGADVRQISSADLLSAMSLVFQDVILLRDTVTENIRIARPQATDKEVRRAAALAQVDDVVQRLPNGYDTVLGAGEGGLSGGEQQRLTIARAILSDAPIVVLDEATASLDPDSETAVQEALSTLAAGKTVVVIAHRLHTIAGADQIVVLDEGRIAEIGSHQDLLSHSGLYSRLWRAQQNGSPA